MKRNNINYFKHYPIIGCGENGTVYKYFTYAVKVLKTPYSIYEIKNANSVNHKLKILKKLDLPIYVKVKQLYYYEDYNKDLIWAYKMEYLKDNKLNKFFDLFKYNLEQKNIILLKILDILNQGNKYNIYNFDLQLENFYLSKYNKMKGIDVDNLRIGKYDSEKKLNYIADFIYRNNCQRNGILIENYALLRLALSLWTTMYDDDMDLDEVRMLIYNLDIDCYLKDTMLAITYAQDGVNLSELINGVSSHYKLVPYKKR